MQSILVVDDEAEIAGFIRRGLLLEGYRVAVAPDGQTAIKLLTASPFDLVLLDLMLPGLDGFAIAERIRAAFSIPIIMLTARSTVADRVAGLELGADDYLIKPFAFEELLARIKVQFRRTRNRSDPSTLTMGSLVMDLTARRVRQGNRTLELTAKEWDLLELLIRHPDQVMTRSQIYDHVWGYDYGTDSNVIDVHIRALRMKLEQKNEQRILHTIRNVGYVLRPPAPGDEP
ncbi:MAG: response regulator transcription factor [Herpetosiphon sp.]